MKDISHEKYARYSENLEKKFRLLHFNELRFKICFDPIEYDGKMYNIVTCIPYIASVQDCQVQSFAFLHEFFIPDGRHLHFIEVEKAEYFVDTSFHNSPTENPDDLDSYICLIVSGRIIFKYFQLDKDEVLRGYIEGTDVFDELICDIGSTNGTYFPFNYDDDVLRELGIPGVKLEMLTLYHEGHNDSFIVSFAKYHLSILRHEKVLEVLESIRSEYLRSFSISQETSYHTVECDFDTFQKLREQEWYFHLQCVFQVYADYFETSAEKSTRDRILAYCKSRICDLKPAKLTQTIANVSGTSYSGVVLRNVHDWLVERGHITMQGADNEESVNHFIYITSGKKEELVRPELKRQRIKWIGKDKYIFVTFIKELRGSFQDGEVNKDPYVEWEEIHNQFDVDFGEPINGEFARKVTRTTCYKERSRLRISGHGDVRDLYLVFHPKQQQ